MKVGAPLGRTALHPVATNLERLSMTTSIRTRRRAPVRQRNLDLQSAVSPEAIVARIPNDPNDGLALTIEYRAPGDLTPPPRQLRKISKRQDATIRAGIRSFGNLNPILIDGEGQVICGEARWRAAIDLSLEQVPTVTVTHLNEAQLRLFRIAEERVVELSEWDDEAMRAEFKELSELDLSLDVNLELSGFSTSEIDQLTIEPVEKAPSSERHPSHAPVTQRSDLWQLGDHKLYCGDGLEEESYAILMGDERAQMAFADAPYNLPMATISGQDREEFAQASGEMSSGEFTTFLRSAFMLMARFSEDGAIHFQCMDWRHCREMLDAGEAAYNALKNLIIWDKQTGGQGSFYRSQHEMIWAWKVGTASHINNFGLGKTGRYRTNVWSCPGQNSFHRFRGEELASHPTVKPEALVADALRDCSHRGGIVLDGFGGSGSTLLAAEHTGRRARLIEIEPRYCDVTIERWQAKTSCEAVHVESGKTWREMAAMRGVDLSVCETSEGEAS